MCFGGGGKDTSEQLRNQEEERQTRIRASTGAINNEFNKFDSNYFGNIAQSVRDYYYPKVDEEFRTADRQRTFHFADNAGSSANARSVADLVKEYGRARAGVDLEAGTASDSARRDVESERSRLVTLAEAGGTTENVAAQSAAIANQNIGRPTFNPVTDFFRKYTSQLGNAQIMRQQGYQPSSFWTGPTDFLRSHFSGGSGSATTVGG